MNCSFNPSSLFSFSVEVAARIHTLVSMRAKIVSLGLDQISLKPGVMVTIDISQVDKLRIAIKEPLIAITSVPSNVIQLFGKVLDGTL